MHHTAVVSQSPVPVTSLYIREMQDPGHHPASSLQPPTSWPSQWRSSASPSSSSPVPSSPFLWTPLPSQCWLLLATGGTLIFSKFELSGHISCFFSEDLDSCWLWADSGAGPPVLPLAMPPPQHAPGLEILFRALTSELRWWALMASTSGSARPSPATPSSQSQLQQPLVSCSHTTPAGWTNGIQTLWWKHRSQQPTIKVFILAGLLYLILILLFFKMLLLGKG